MTQQADRLLEEAMHLPEQERGNLAAKLIESLDPVVESDDEVEQAWGAEIQRRLDDLRTGAAKPVPWLEARRMIMDDTNDSAPA